MLGLLACLPLALLITLPFVAILCEMGPGSLPLPAKAMIGICISLLVPPTVLWVLGSAITSFGLALLDVPLLVYGYFSMVFQPSSTVSTIAPVSSLPVAILMSIYILAYAGQSVARFGAFKMGMYSQFTEKFPVMNMFQAVVNSVVFVPMLCILFMGYQQRVASEPGLLIKLFMLSSVLAQIAKTGSVFAIPAKSLQNLDERSLQKGKMLMADPKDKYAPPVDAKLFGDAKKDQAFAVGAKVSNAATYVAAVLVLLGWGTYVLTPGPAAYTCVGIVCFTYFAIQTGIFGIRQTSPGGSQFEDILDKATNTLSLAPMLCASLLLGRRLGGTDGSWFETVPAVSATASMLMQTVLTIAVPLLVGGKAYAVLQPEKEGEDSKKVKVLLFLKDGKPVHIPDPEGFSMYDDRWDSISVKDGDGESQIIKKEQVQHPGAISAVKSVGFPPRELDMEYEVENQMMKSLLGIARYLILFMFYVLGIGMHLAWMLTIVFSSCSADLPGTASFLLALMFWRTYIYLYFANTCREFTGYEWMIVTESVQNGKTCIQRVLSIMLVLLFVDPQMHGPLSFIVTYALPVALLSQYVWINIICFAIGRPAQCEDSTIGDGFVQWEPENLLLMHIVNAGRVASFGLLNGGLLAGCLYMILSNF